MIPTTASHLDMLTRWAPVSPGRSAFHTGIDNATGTLRCVGSGIWHPQDADRYFSAQRKIIDEARRRFGAVKLFCDIRQWVVENPDSALQFQAMNAEMYRPEDRLVTVVNSCVDKQHPRAAFVVGNLEVFLSMNAAETWLQAYSIDRKAA